LREAVPRRREGFGERKGGKEGLHCFFYYTETERKDGVRKAATVHAMYLDDNEQREGRGKGEKPAIPISRMKGDERLRTSLFSFFSATMGEKRDKKG